MIKTTYIAFMFSLLAGSALVQAQSGAEAVAAAEVKVGDKAPGFELMNSQGEKVSLKDYEGKKTVVLSFNRAHWCPFCMRQLVQLRKDYDKFAEAGAEVLVVFREERDGLEGMKKSAKVSQGSFPILLDEKSAQTKVYSQTGYDTYIIDKDGKVAAKIEGTKKKRASNEEILAALKK
ncbi:redoxin domain-containing protein [Verrucomicrobiaceae bacterium 5K15]|uniref:thioredoxin-dependent peroxiredoxin n=1 Tax=Oceaniferula flava TaxID=2800421 RepID=A0AAE2SB70_9BACT|nr:peroxiredoxin family protein [Oceaniferula flavus]MBK1855228.1 redoxin domain-containing protein [Oceaniferula flavus]MBM1136534.1 redoxin domain-containing protein [Oceaniferula flavus]